MDPKYKEKMRGLAIGAVGGKEAYDELMKKRNPQIAPTDSSVDAATSQRFRDVQQALVDQEQRRNIPSDATEVNLMRPPQVSPELEQQMLEELMSEEPQPPIQSKRFSKLINR